MFLSTMLFSNIRNKSNQETVPDPLPSFFFYLNLIHDTGRHIRKPSSNLAHSLNYIQLVIC